MYGVSMALSVPIVFLFHQPKSIHQGPHQKPTLKSFLLVRIRIVGRKDIRPSLSESDLNVFMILNAPYLSNVPDWEGAMGNPFKKGGEQ